MTPYYSDEAVTIYHGDCREVLPSLSEIDLVLTSPPYNKGRSDDGRELSPQQRIGHYRKDAPLNSRGGHGLWMGNKLSEGYEDHSSKAYENLKQPVETEHYRNEAVYFTAKGLEALAFESVEGNN